MQFPFTFEGAQQASCSVSIVSLPRLCKFCFKAQVLSSFTESLRSCTAHEMPRDNVFRVDVLTGFVAIQTETFNVLTGYVPVVHAVPAPVVEYMSSAPAVSLVVLALAVCAAPALL